MGRQEVVDQSDERAAAAAPAWWTRAARNEFGADPEGGPQGSQKVAAPAWTSRALAGATAAVLAIWLTTHVLPHPPLTPAAAALLAALLITSLPRVGWLAMAAAATALLALQHRPGPALLIAIAMLVPLLAVPRTPTSWPLAAIAPGLGAVGLAGAWPALAAHASSTARRAALAATGWIWIDLITPLAGKSLYTKATILPPSHWIHSTAATGTHILSPLITANTAATVLIWAAGAAILPAARSRRPIAAGVLAVTTCSIALAIATTIAAPPILAGEAVLGAVAAVVFTLAPDVTKRLLHPDAPRRLA